jgi:2-furoyl-CoA dehydrogenase FAD binding subunit
MMKSSPFVVYQPKSLPEAVQLSTKHGEEAKIIAGGQTLVPMLAMRIATPAILIDINEVQELQSIVENDTLIEVGAAVSQARLEDYLSSTKVHPLLSSMMPWIAHRPIRNRGTVGGSIAHADPSAELVLALSVLKGWVILANSRQQRKVSAEEFFLGALQTDRQMDEILVKVVFPKLDKNAQFGFVEYGYRHGDFAVVSVAMMKINQEWTFAYGGINDTPQVFTQRLANYQDAFAYVAHLANTVDVREDPTASSDLRRHLMQSQSELLIRQIESGKE